MSDTDPTASSADSSLALQRKVQPPRPPNAWIIYRSEKFAQIRQGSERLPQSTVSKLVSAMWKSESEEVRRHFERKAEKKKAEHQLLYPDYRFSPVKKEEKLRAKEERKRNRRRGKAKANDATAAHTVADATTTASAMVPWEGMPYMPPYYQPNMILPHPYIVPYVPETYYGPTGPSPLLLGAPSPASHENSKSPEAQPSSRENTASSLSSPSSPPPSSSSSQLHSGSLYSSPVPSSHHLSLNPYVPQPLPQLPFQSPTPSELPLASPQVQHSFAENATVPAAPLWNNIPTQMSTLHPQNVEEVVNFDIPISQTQSFARFPQVLRGSSSLESVQEMISNADGNSAFNLSQVETSELVAQPKGELEVGMGPPAPTLDYDDHLFTDFDYTEFERHMASMAARESGSVVAAPSVEEDLQTFFLASNNPEIEAYNNARQRQPSVFTQDLVNFLDLEAAESAAEDTCSNVSPASLPTTVAPQDLCLQNVQHSPPMPIFTPMTNTATGASSTPYVPPAGAVYSSTRPPNVAIWIYH